MDEFELRMRSGEGGEKEVSFLSLDFFSTEGGEDRDERERFNSRARLR